MSDAPSYLVDNLIPSNQMHILAGASGAGKTTLLLQLLRDLLDGKPWFGHNAHPCTLGYVATDRPTTEHFEKFQIMNVVPFAIHSLLYNRDYRPGHLKSIELRMEVFDKIWVGLERPQLMVIDPLSPFFPSNLIDYHLVADALIVFARWCQDNNVTIIGTHHAAKLRPDTQYTRAQDRILGSAALQGYSGTHLFLADAAEGKGYHVLTVVPHNYLPQEYALIRDRETGIFLPASSVKDTVDIMAVLHLVPYVPDVIDAATLTQKGSESIDKSTRTVERIVKKLTDEARIFRPEQGSYSRRRPS